MKQRKKTTKDETEPSDVVLRTLKSQGGDLDRFFGAWKDKDYSKIQGKILADRKRSRSRDVRFK